MTWLKGKHRAGPDNGRLRQELKFAERRITWYRGRLRVVSAQTRALRARAEIAEGRLLASEQLVYRQVVELQAHQSRIAELQRLIEASGEDTVETPIPQAAPELAGVAS